MGGIGEFILVPLRVSIGFESNCSIFYLFGFSRYGFMAYLYGPRGLVVIWGGVEIGQGHLTNGTIWLEGITMDVIFLFFIYPILEIHRASEPLH